MSLRTGWNATGTGTEMVLTPRNIVATVNLECRLDLKTIALHARNAEYNPKVRLRPCPCLLYVYGVLLFLLLSDIPSPTPPIILYARWPFESLGCIHPFTAPHISYFIPAQYPTPTIFLQLSSTQSGSYPPPPNQALLWLFYTSKSPICIHTQAFTASGRSCHTPLPDTSVRSLHAPLLVSLTSCLRPHLRDNLPVPIPSSTRSARRSSPSLFIFSSLRSESLPVSWHLFAPLRE
jgi:hypothetical protein